MNQAFNMDCLEAMRQMEDNAFDLAVVDPPYGDGGGNFNGALIGRFGGRFEKYHLSDSQTVNAERERERESRPRPSRHHTFGLRKSYRNYENRWQLEQEVRKKITSWDVAPGQEYFDQLFRISRNQIICGGNYFALPPTGCFLIWRKLSISDSFSMAMCEYAWTSFNENAKWFEYAPQDTNRFHPTQKPVALYKWILSKYAKPGDRILDTHLGSGSSRIAAYDLGFDFVGYEIDKFYFDKQEERFAKHTAQTSLFV